MTHITPPAANIGQRMQQIAARLGELYRLKAGAEFETSEQEAEYQARLLAIVPADGWPGENEEARTTARKQAEAADEILLKMRGELGVHRAALADYGADIQALEAERRALEWTVRAGLAKMIAGAQDGANIEDQADAWADDTVTLTEWPADVFDQAEGEF